MLSIKQKLCQQWCANKRAPRRWRISLATFNHAAALFVWWYVMSVSRCSAPSRLFMCVCCLRQLWIENKTKKSPHDSWALNYIIKTLNPQDESHITKVNFFFFPLYLTFPMAWSAGGTVQCRCSNIIDHAFIPACCYRNRWTTWLNFWSLRNLFIYLRLAGLIMLNESCRSRPAWIILLRRYSHAKC